MPLFAKDGVLLARQRVKLLSRGCAAGLFICAPPSPVATSAQPRG